MEEKLKKYRVYLICFAELIILTVYSLMIISKGTTDLSFDESGIYADSADGPVDTNVLKAETSDSINYLRTQGVTLERGIYDVTVEYRTDTGGMAEAFGQTINGLSMWQNTASLSPVRSKASFQVWANDETYEFGVLVRSYGGELSVEHIRIKTAWNSRLYFIVCFLVKICALDLLLFGIMFRERLRKYSVNICGILGITFICSLGLFTRYLMGGHDILFHMNRIEGLKDGLLSGAFPVRIQPTWNNGWGYAVSVMYGDLTLLFPALMRICGFTVQTTWKTFIVAVNFATAALSFYSFREICRDKYKALFAALIYCTGMYRMACIYVRAAAGEFTVMMFLPLVVLGFWYAFEEDIGEEEYGKKLIPPVMGFTGMIQTHVLTCEMSALFILALCIIMIKKVLRKKTFLYLLKIVIATVLVNLWFLVPFLDFLREDLVISQMSEMRDDFRIWGLSVTELFATSASNAYGFTFGENTSLANKCTFTVGLALWGSAAMAFLLLWNKKVEKPKAAIISLAFGITAVCLTTNLFPYHLIKKYVPFLASVLSKIQFSYRFLGLTGLFFTLAVLLALLRIRSDKAIKRYLPVFLILLSALAIFQGMDYQYQIIYGGAFELKYSPAAIDTTFVSTGEYLYRDSSVDVTNTDVKVTGSGAEVLASEKRYLKTSVTCSASQKDAFIEIPVFYYPGYVAVDTKGEEYRVSRSMNNNRIRVDIPEGFAGTIDIFYREPIYFRICEIISLIALTGLLLQDRKSKKNRLGQENNNG